ncbi:SDR family oxidoreductase [Moheibacter lacus]|uniref:SDR family oxidoreductase n=1 Tax=Moheibacter lacus TaxID=2745851 RepID=A0A838ZR26_9FLAO|nr:SDR family oxidoreductase [Moheibacter lacus]MBA5628493.1 SDR family oxidoreductase [Moheibacter lacus]
MNLENKIVWITGASSGIGKQLALNLAKRNCKLILSSRNLEKLDEVKTECQKFTSDAVVLPLDLEKIELLKPKGNEAVEAFGKIDVLIHCGGLSQRSLIAETEIEVDQKLMNVDYLGTVALTKSILPHFKQNQTGTFVVISSVMGKFGSPYRSGYCAAKHALHGFFDVLRMEHEKDQIKVTIICPGFVNTDVTRNAVMGDGSIYRQQDKKTEEGLDVKDFTKRMIRAIEKEKFEVYIGGKEAKAVYLKRFFPKLLHKVIMKSQVR